MYRYSNGQISLADFKQPVGMNLKEGNHWVKKAQTIPWLEIEKRYAALFTNRKGNVAKPLRLALGACIIQAEYGFSDEETALQIQENPYLQYFCGYPGYDDEKLPFDPSLMVYFRKRLTPEVLGEINEIIVRDAKERQAKETKSRDDDDDSGNHPGTGGNSGTMIVDATCAPSNIRYLQDVSLLNEARENAEKLLDVLHDPADGKKPRTYRKRARKDYLEYTRCRKHTAKMTRKAIGKQLAYLRRDLDAIDGKLALGKSLTTRQMERLDTIRTIYEQQKYMYDNHTHSVPDRIVSVSQPFVRPIVRGKAGKPVEFGAKLDISVVDGWTRLECCSFDAYNEAGNLQEMAERFRKREGHYPSRILADKIYRNRENLNDCKEHGIRLSGPALGRPKQGETSGKAQDYRDECERVEVERRFSLAKRKCGMELVTAKLRETAAHVIAMSVLVLNLRKIQCTLFRLQTGHMMKGDTIVDATIINAPSSTKNAEKARDPEMHQTKKGNEWKFGMKCHIGVDAGSGLVHTMTVTAANEHDITQTAKLLREDDGVVYGDSGYLGVQKRSENTSNEHFSNIDFRINRRPSSLPRVSDNAIDWERYIENRKSAVRCKVEHAFRIIKCQFGYKKTVYRGLMKNENRLYAMFACANLYALAIAGRKLSTT